MIYISMRCLQILKNHIHNDNIHFHGFEVVNKLQNQILLKFIVVGIQK